MTLAKDKKTMMDHLEQLYLKRHPDWAMRKNDGALRSFIQGLAIRELYAIEVEVYGSLESALKENV